MEGEVMEGFLCPLCYKDLKTAVNLNIHFQEHSQDDQNILKSVRGLYDKAVKKIKGVESNQQQQDEAEASTSTSSRRIPGYSASPIGDCNLLIFKNHTDRFKALRDLRNERYALQTNKLLIRLGKLLQQLPSDPVRRKAYEREIVPWLDETSVNLCPSCAKPFNLLKRKHHCRLCGSVMCRDCTFLLSLEDAAKMVGSSNPASANSSPLNKPVQAVQAVLTLESVSVSDFRICEHCERLLRAREMSRQIRNERPILAQFYDRLSSATQACSEAVDRFNNVYSSLCNGETVHTLEEANALRIEVIRLADNVDSTSKKIAALGTNSSSPPSSTSLKLQQSIRNAAAQFLKKSVISLPSLPTEEDLLEYQKRRRLAMERKIEEELRREIDDEQKLEWKDQMKNLNISSNSSPGSSSKTEKITLEEGWTPSVKQAIISDDPILQQIGILHGYLDQAKLAGKVDEIASLQKNLFELERFLDQREFAEN